MDDGKNYSFIRSWLSQIHHPGEEPGESAPDDDWNENQPWRPHDLPLQMRAHTMNRALPEHHGSVAWDTPLRSLSSQSRKEHGGVGSSNVVHKGLCGEHEVNVSEETDPGYSSVKENRFSKRPRKKTRDDRYDTTRRKRQKQSHNEDARQTRTSHPKMVHQRTNRKTRSGEDVMNNFKSPHIHVDHITMPQLTKGLFGNRIVSKQGVADLDFNNIRFVDRDGSTGKEHRNVIKEKGERRRSQILREEEEMFACAFSRSKSTPRFIDETVELSSSRGRPLSRVCNTERQHDSASMLNTRDSHHRFESNSASQSSQVSEKAAVNPRLSSTSSGVDILRAASYPARKSRHKPLCEQEHHQEDMPLNDLKALVETGIFNSLDQHFEKVMKYRQKPPGLDNVSSSEQLEEPFRRYREACWDSPRQVLTSIHGNYRNEDETKNRTESSQTLPVDNYGNEVNGLNIGPMHDPSRELQPESRGWWEVDRVFVPQRMQPRTAPPAVTSPSFKDQSWSRLDDGIHMQGAIPFLSERFVERSYDVHEPLSPMTRMPEELPTQYQLDHLWDGRQPENLGHKNQRTVHITSPPVNKNGRGCSEALDDLMRRTDEEILGESFVGQHSEEYDDHYETEHGPLSRPQLQESQLKGSSCDNWAESRSPDIAPFRPGRTEPLSYHQHHTQWHVRDGLELRDFW